MSVDNIISLIRDRIERRAERALFCRNEGDEDGRNSACRKRDELEDLLKQIDPTYRDPFEQVMDLMGGRGL